MYVYLLFLYKIDFEILLISKIGLYFYVYLKVNNESCKLLRFIYFESCLSHK